MRSLINIIIIISRNIKNFSLEFAEYFTPYSLKRYYFIAYDSGCFWYPIFFYPPCFHPFFSYEFSFRTAFPYRHKNPYARYRNRRKGDRKNMKYWDDLKHYLNPCCWFFSDSIFWSDFTSHTSCRVLPHTFLYLRT